MKKLSIVFIICLFTFSVVGCSSHEFAPKAARSIAIIAHRGADDQAPEETMPAFKLAIQEKATYIEMDLRETKDNKLVLMHDQTLDRTTNGTGKVSKYSLQQLKTLDTGSWFNKKYKDQKILSLAELINQYGSKTNYFIETRQVDHKLKMERALLDLLNSKGLIKKNKVIIESFSAMSLKKIREMNHKIPLVQLTLFHSPKAFTPKTINAWKQYAMGIGLSSDLVNKKLIRKLHQNQFKAYVFFFDAKQEKAEQKRVIKDEADGVFTNHIPYTESLLKSLN